jgi:hypothetical protein
MDCMTTVFQPDGLWRRSLALVLAAALLLPLVVLPAASVQAARRQMSTKQKVVLLAGAALLYYMYRKHQATTAKNAAKAGTTNGKPPQLYRSKNGGVYYRDPQGKPVWLTVPAQGMQVPASEVQQYAPNYSQVQGPAPTTPKGYTAQAFTQFDPTLAPAATHVPASTPVPAGAPVPPGPGHK